MRELSRDNSCSGARVGVQFKSNSFCVTSDNWRGDILNLQLAIVLVLISFSLEIVLGRGKKQEAHSCDTNGHVPDGSYIYGRRRMGREPLQGLALDIDCCHTSSVMLTNERVDVDCNTL